MLETSKDLLNILIGVSVFIVAILLSYLFYQMASMIRNVNKTMSSIQNMVEGVNQLVKKIKEKTDSAGNYVALFIKSAQQILEFVTKNKKKSSDRDAKKAK